MDEQALKALFEALKTPTDIKHITPSAAVIDVLKRESMALDTAGFSATCAACARLLAAKHDFIVQKAPAILSSYYFIMREDVNQKKLQPWLDGNSHWQEVLSAVCDDADALQDALDAMVLEINAS